MDNHINDILTGCSNNDRKSQKELYELFSKPVFSICYRYESRLSVIKELVNESFIRVFKNIRKFVDNQYTDTYVQFSLQAWIRQIVVLTCIEYYRKGLMNYEVPLVQAETKDKIKKDSTNMQTFSHKQMIETIRQLPPADRIIYNLFAIEKMSLEKIADLLKISANESQSALERARVGLKNSLYIQNFGYKNKTADSPYPMISEADSKAS